MLEGIGQLSGGVPFPKGEALLQRLPAVPRLPSAYELPVEPTEIHTVTLLPKEKPAGQLRSLPPPQVDKWLSGKLPENDFLLWIVSASAESLDGLDMALLTRLTDKLSELGTPAQKRDQERVWAKTEKHVKTLLKKSGMKDPDPATCDAFIDSQLQTLDAHTTPQQLAQLILTQSSSPANKSEGQPRLAKPTRTQLRQVAEASATLSTWVASTSVQPHGGPAHLAPALDAANAIGLVAAGVRIHRGRALTQIGKAIKQQASRAHAEGNELLSKAYTERADKALRQGRSMVLSASCGFAASLTLTASGAAGIVHTTLDLAAETAHHAATDIDHHAVADGTISALSDPSLQALAGAASALCAAGGAIACFAGILQLATGTRNVVKAVAHKQDLIKFVDEDLKAHSELPGTEAEVRLALDLVDYRRKRLNTKILGNSFEIAGGTAAIAAGACTIAAAAGAASAGTGTIAIAVVGSALLLTRIGIIKYREHDWREYQKDLDAMGEHRSTEGALFAGLYLRLKAEQAARALRQQELPELIRKSDGDLRIALEFETSTRRLDAPLPRRTATEIFTELCPMVLGITADTYIQLVEASTERYQYLAAEPKPSTTDFPSPSDVVVNMNLDPITAAKHLLAYMDEQDPTTKQRHLELLTLGDMGTAYRPQGAPQIQQEEIRRKRVLRDLATLRRSKRFEPKVLTRLSEEADRCTKTLKSAKERLQQATSPSARAEIRAVIAHESELLELIKNEGKSIA